MTTPEQVAWDSLRPVLAGLGLDPRRVENVVGPGHPDVDYAGGNIELKHLAEWPRRLSTLVQVPKYTGEQAGWLAQRWKAGGLSWLMVRAGPAWFLFDGWTALSIYRGLPQHVWHEEAAMVYPGNVRGWAGFPVRADAHSYQRQLAEWLRFDLSKMQPWSRARAMRLRCCSGLVTVAGNIGWTQERLLDTELGRGKDDDVDTLLSYWES